MRFAVIGHGFVGKAITSVLSDKHEVIVVDPFESHETNKLKRYCQSFGNLTIRYPDNVNTVDGFVICVPTPQADNGRCDDTLVAEYVAIIQSEYPQAQILIKSTTSVDTLGTFDGNVTFSPEFLRGSVGTDPTKEFRDCNFTIYGGDGGRWWHEVFSQLLTINDVRFLDIESAGFLKYAENSFLATKVIFFNELENLYSNTIDCNFNAMIEALALDKRVGMSHTQVPGPDGWYGFGGHCLPKDTSEFAGWAREMNEPLHLLEQVRALNIDYRDK